MIQYVTQWPASPDIAGQVRGVVAGGCRWIELSAPGMELEELRRVCDEVRRVCEPAEAFVIMREHPELAAEYRFHGILLDSADSVKATRERLGGEAVIGVRAASLDEIMRHRLADIDYYVTPGDLTPVVAEARAQGVKTPIVAEGDFELPHMRRMLGAGYSGFAVGRAVAEAPEGPQAAMRSLIDALAG